MHFISGIVDVSEIVWRDTSTDKPVKDTWVRVEDTVIYVEDT